MSVPVKCDEDIWLGVAQIGRVWQGRGIWLGRYGGVKRYKNVWQSKFGEKGNSEVRLGEDIWHGWRGEVKRDKMR